MKTALESKNFSPVTGILIAAKEVNYSEQLWKKSTIIILILHVILAERK